MNHHNCVALNVMALGFVPGKHAWSLSTRCYVGDGRFYWLLGTRTYLATNRRYRPSIEISYADVIPRKLILYVLTHLLGLAPIGC